MFCCAFLVNHHSAIAQVQFRNPAIPKTRSISGKLISQPTTRATTLAPLSEPQDQTGEAISGQWNDRPSSFQDFTPFNEQEKQNESSQSLTKELQEYLKSDPNAIPLMTTEDNPSSGFPVQIDGKTYQSQGTSNLEQLPPPIDEQESRPRAGETDTVIQRFPNGKKRIVREVAQDKDGNFSNHGTWEAFDLNGKVVAAGQFKQGIMQGQWRREHTKSEGGLFVTRPFDLFQGPYLSVANFKDGKLDGLWTIYDQVRTKIFEISYKDGVRHGTATWWYPNQGKMREATFKDGLLHGAILGWDEAEKLTRREEYLDGRRIVRNTTFYRPKQPKQQDFFLDSKLEPEGEDNWWEAEPTNYLPRGAKEKNGGSASWYENGQLKSQGQFKADQAVGRFIWWHENGNKSIQGFFENGVKNRTWTWWYENGMKKAEGAYKDDQPVGIWRGWYDDGTLKKEKDYSSTTETGSSSTEDDSETPDPNSPEDGTGSSVIDPNIPVPSKTEELPAPMSEDPTKVETGGSIIETNGDSEEPKVPSDEQPIDPRQIDPFGEIPFENQSESGDGTIPGEFFKGGSNSSPFRFRKSNLNSLRSNFIPASSRTIKHDHSENKTEKRALFWQTPKMDSGR